MYCRSNVFEKNRVARHPVEANTSIVVWNVSDYLSCLAIFCFSVMLQPDSKENEISVSYAESTLRNFATHEKQ